MAKLATTLALVAALMVLMASVSYGRTTITMVEVEERSRGHNCREQVRRQQLNQCERFVSRRNYLGVEDELGLEDKFGSSWNDSPDAQQCCSQLRQLDSQCQCEGVKYVVQKQLQRGTGMGQDQVLQKARTLQNICGLPQLCDIRAFLDE